VKNKQDHYWMCAVTGLLAGFLAIFISTHNFEFFWPLNWPIKITAVLPPQPVTISMPTTIYTEDLELPGARTCPLKRGDCVCFAEYPQSIPEVVHYVLDGGERI
jgi:hypothetical protein